MTIGERIKDLRKKNDLTQEKLADYLCVSYQAVSKWECGLSSPDLLLVAPLTKLLHVSADELLGLNDGIADARRAEFDKAYNEYWKKDKNEYHHIAAQAVAKYPGDLKYLEWLASSEYYIALTLNDDNAYHDMLNKAVKHYETVLENCNDEILWDKALQGMVLSLHYNGSNDEAKAYAMRQENEEKRDQLLNWCLNGEEKKKHNQKMLDRKLRAFVFQLSIGQERLEAYEAVEGVLEIMFPDENFQMYHNILQYNCIGKSFILCNQKRYDEAVAELKKARCHAEKMMKLCNQKTYRYTAPLFDCLEIENPEPNDAGTDLYDFFNSLKNRCFDPLREREDFKKFTIE